LVIWPKQSGANYPQAKMSVGTTVQWHFTQWQQIWLQITLKDVSL